MHAVEQLASDIPVAPTCAALGVPRATYYRRKAALTTPSAEPRARAASPRALSARERQTVRETLNSDRFADQAPAEIYATLLDEGTYHCSIRTMYRVLHEADEVRERRNQLRHPVYHKPELLATAPNQVWSWDITKLLGPAKWTYYYLYVMLDVYSRYVVGWMLAPCESGELARRLMRESCDKQAIEPEQLTIHSDRGPAMRSQTVAQLLATLGVVKSHSRPHVSNDNPFSESQFKTLKYQSDFPERFESLEHGLEHCREFISWYNGEHRHWGLGLLTPEVVHFGRAPAVLAARELTLTAAYQAHPERFVQHPPRPLQLPAAVYINPPSDAANRRGDSDEKFTNCEVSVSQSY